MSLKALLLGAMGTTWGIRADTRYEENIFIVIKFYLGSLQIGALNY